MKRIVNKNARRKYSIKEVLEAGIVLTGAETKAIKTRGVELRDAFVRVKGNEPFLINAVIHPYPFAPKEDQDSSRERKLLLKESEIKRLIGKKRAKLTIVPLACYTRGRWIKIQLGVGRKKTKKQRKRDLIEKELKKKGMY